MRHVNKFLVNLVGSSRSERKVILYVDARYSTKNIPPWMKISEGNLSINQSIDKSI